MRFGNRRRLPLAFAIATILGLSMTSATFAGGWPSHTLPGEVPAYDYSTGGEYFAPPVPYGHYAKDPIGHVAKSAGLVHGLAKDLFGKLGNGLGHGSGSNHGCSGDNCGNGNCSGNGHGLGLHNSSGACGNAGNGCGFCSGGSLFNHGGTGLGGLLSHGGAAADCEPGHAIAGLGHGHKHKNFAPHHHAVMATSQVLPAAQAAAPSAQGTVAGICGEPGCGMGGKHSHLGGLLGKIRCRLCGGNGCGGCGGAGIGDPCNGCGGAGFGGGSGCGMCGGCGLFKNGLGHGGTGCGMCGGKGCGNCLSKLAGLGSKAHGLLGAAKGLLFHQKFEYFVGPGGPVPLTPGYVPYIVTTRSPRDFFSFPPMNPNDP